MSDKERCDITLKITVNKKTIDGIDQYRRTKEKIPSRSQAIRDLIQLGLLRHFRTSETE